eukprot:5709909-Prymnesium_polylepis.1
MRAVLALAVLGLCAAYDLGDDISLCWATNRTTGEMSREDCRASTVEFVSDPPSDIVAGREYT